MGRAVSGGSDGQAGSSGMRGRRMTKLTHYGRMRSVTARVLRMADPLAAQQRAALDVYEETGDEGHHQPASEGLLMPPPPTAAAAATAATASASTSAAVADLPALAGRFSLENGGGAHAPPESSIGIPMPGFFLDPASDEWAGGHSFRQRLRFPDEAVTVPASLTKRVHYEVSYDYPKNAISTARYNVVTFLPAQVAAQFSKVANVYFLFVAALQQVPGWSTTGRWSTVLPLCVFVSLSIAHEGFDDLRRHRMDHAENAQRTRVLKVKVHDREDRVAFTFRGLRHRGSQSIHSFRMRSSQSMHGLRRSTLAGARRWGGAVVGVGASVRAAVGSRIADSRRKKRELEDSDDDDDAGALLDATAAADDVDAAMAPDAGGPGTPGGNAAESLLRRRLGRGVASLRSWRGAGSTAGMQGPPARPVVAFNDLPDCGPSPAAAGEGDGPLPSHMSCRWKRKRWENVQVGDLIMIGKDEWVPADCMVVASSGFDGTCFVETAALDGETTLKQKQALGATNSAVQTPEQLAAFNAFTYVEAPSPELYAFEGCMEIAGRRFALTPNQLLLRGSVLRNTAYVFAQVVYAGEHTRLRLNATRNVRTKAPQIQRITNRAVIVIFVLLLAACLGFAGLGLSWDRRHRKEHWYLHGVHVPASALIFGYIVMMNALIPISLYVTLEAVKIFQCWLIQQDIAMYHAPADARAEARTTAINEDLGMVRYVFSDKTGTLTENIMKLRAIMVAGFSYLHADVDRMIAANTDKDHARDGRAAKELQPVPTPTLSPSATPGRQSPALLHAAARSPHVLFAEQDERSALGRHRRQQSLPVPSPALSISGSPLVAARTLQQLAVANRAAGGLPRSASPYGHSRGVSAASPLLRSMSRLEEATAASDIGDSDADPDLSGDGPALHTAAGEDAPVSDLLRLPSSRGLTDGQQQQQPPSEGFRTRAEWFLRCLALCHTVQPDRDPLTGRITGYQATSPDEKALVAAAAELGYVMNNRVGPLVQLRVVPPDRMRDFNAALLGSAEDRGGSTAKPSSSPSSSDCDSFDRGVPAPAPFDRLGNYEVLDVLEFSSARKRMSVVYRCPDGRIVMMSKGADSALWPRLLALDRMSSDPADVSFLPRQSPPLKLPASQQNRKLSFPSAAYLHHSRTSSAASANMDFARHNTDASPLTDASLAFPPRAVSRLGASSSLAARRGLALTDGDGAGGGDLDDSGRRCRSPLMPADDDYDDSDYAEDRFHNYNQQQQLPPPPPILPAYASPRSPFRQVAEQHQQHRRMMSDSQFSAISEVSSFGDTQGRVEEPASFTTPSREEEEWARGRALEALHQFSTEGLRTLVYAHREVPPEYYENWHQRHAAASTALVNRQQQVEALCDEIERDLLLTGISAIEDRLQAGVPETIFKLRRAGIRVWMLTGDKVETAINIAKSCRLIDTEVVEITALDRGLPADRMALLVMQSITDRTALDRLLTDALAAARALTAASSVDQRFEALTARQRLARGLKRFGNILDPRRLRHRRRWPNILAPGYDGVVRHDHAPEEDTLTMAPNGACEKCDPLAPATALDTANGSLYRPPTTEVEWGDSQLPQPSMPPPPPQLGLAGNNCPDSILEAPVYSPCAGNTASSAATTTTTTKAASPPSPASSTASLTTRGIAEKQPFLSSEMPQPPGVGNSSGGSPSLAVVIDGETLAALEEYAHDGLLDRFLTLGTLCDAVICSRVSPSQKALVVHNMRVRCEQGNGAATKDHTTTGEGGDKHTTAGKKASWWWLIWNPVCNLLCHDNDKYMVTLAIGDGGNDIAMIQEAHVGIGIAGQEGLQASRAADFSIGQFRFLQRLLLVHGRWCYVRVSMFIMGTFYKCMAFYTTQLIFQFYTGFSGTSLFESWTLSMYNTLFSILPVLVVGIFEQDLQPATLLAYPELYRDMGPRNHLFTVPLFLWRVVLIGTVHAVIAAFFPFATNLFLGHSASSMDLYITG
ncbi:hypothetical protein GGI04_002158, partial [Coemansia thaxteri]